MLNAKRTQPVLKGAPEAAVSIGAASLIATLIVLTLRALGWLQPLELLVLDRFVQSRGDRPLNPAIVLVEITEPDLERHGFPLSDALLATVLAELQASQPRVIGLDLYRNLPQGEGYPALVEQLARPNLIALYDEGNAIGPPPSVPVTRTGFNDVVLDPDGVIRRNLFFVSTPEQDYYSFSFRVFLAALANADVSATLLELEVLPDEAVVVDGVALPRLTPSFGAYHNIDANGFQLLLDYKAPQPSVRSVTVTEVLAGQVDPAWLRDRIILIGTTAPSRKDLFRTPYSSGSRGRQLMPGLWLHAQMLSQMLSIVEGEATPFRSWSQPLEVGWFIVWAVLGSSLMLLVKRPAQGVLVIVVVLSLLTLTTWLLFLQYVWIPTIAPALALILAASCTVGYDAYQARQQQLMVMRLLGQNTSPEIADALWESRAELLQSGKLPGQRLLTTIMFADICNFSHTAEMMPPETLLLWLNECLEPFTQMVQDHNGIINKFTGDGFMAVFGLPMARVTGEVAQDACDAVACALKIAKQLEILNQTWRPRQLPSMSMRIGIYTGYVTAGSLGGKNRMEYGVIGDSVNIASRLESCFKERINSVCRILIGQETYELLGNRFQVEDWGPMALKGKAQMVNVYQVIDGATPALNQPVRNI
ncbi:MAG: adenylate/guanylate cyclase domain-containing protein [Cyanobacteria bacterium P01_H01_bin.121]